MNSYDCIVIGSGLGGLIAGALLSNKGKKVLIIEQHRMPGGCATSFNRKGCIFEVSLHQMDGLDAADIKRRIFEELDIFKNIKFIQLPEFYRYVSGSFSMVMPNNYLEAIKVLSEAYPSEKSGIAKFFTTIVKIREQINKLCKSSPLMQHLLYPLYPFLYPAIVFNMNRTLWGFLCKCINDEQLRDFITANMLYYHDDPRTMSLLYYSAAQGSFLKGGCHYIKGSSQELSNYLAGFIEKNGGKLLYNCEVTKIHTRNNKAIGVDYVSKKAETSKETVFAEYVIANAAIPNVANLLSGKARLRLKGKIKGMGNSISLTNIYMIFNLPPVDFGNKHVTTFISGNAGHNDFLKNTRQVDFNDRVFEFYDYSMIDSGLTPDGKYFAVITCADYLEDWMYLSPETYKAKKEEVIQIFIRRLDTVYPGIKNHLEYAEMATPKTIKDYILTPGGSVFGFAQTVKQAVPRRLSNKSSIKNLYFASAWAFPGGGFSGAIISGYNCARYIK